MNDSNEPTDPAPEPAGPAEPTEPAPETTFESTEPSIGPSDTSPSDPTVEQTADPTTASSSEVATKPAPWRDAMRAFRSWRVAVIAVVVFLLGIGIGAATAEDEVVDDAEQTARIAELEEELAEVQTARSQAEDDLRDERGAAREEVSERDARIEELEEQLEEATDELAAFEEFAQAAEEADAEAEAEAEARTFGPGVHVVGTDIQPGTYRTDGPGDGQFDMCYWARLSGLSGEFDDVITNGIPEGPATVEIAESDAAFETSGCEWELVE
jgi:hypothetical protein